VCGIGNALKIWQLATWHKQLLSVSYKILFAIYEKSQNHKKFPTLPQTNIILLSHKTLSSEILFSFSVSNLLNSKLVNNHLVVLPVCWFYLIEINQIYSMFCAKNVNFGRTAFAVSVLTFYGRVALMGIQRKMSSKFFRLLLAGIAAFIAIGLSGCAKAKPLTQNAIQNDLRGINPQGQYVDLLPHCQFFVSRGFRLERVGGGPRTVDITDRGTVIAHKSVDKRAVRIRSSTPGRLQVSDCNGNISGIAGGVEQGRFIDGDSAVFVRILFGRDNNSYIPFWVVESRKDATFQLHHREIQYSREPCGNRVPHAIILEKGSGNPHLMYRLRETTKVSEKTRREKGRRVNEGKRGILPFINR